MPRTSMRCLRMVVILTFILTGAGCIGKNSLSSYARTGDTVMVAIGGEGDVLFLRKEDLTAHLTDSLNFTRPVKVRAVINVYPDPSSRVGAEKADGGFDSWGLRTAVVDLVDPVTGDAPTFAFGNAKLAIKRKVGGAVVATDMALEILPGTGVRNPLAEIVFGNSYVEALEARPQVRYRVRVNAGAPSPVLSAVEFELRIPQSALAGVPATSLPQAVQIANDQNTRFSARHFQEGSFHVVKALLINPNGISNAVVSAADGYLGTSKYGSLRWAVAYGDALLAVSYPPEPLPRAVVTGGTVSFRVYDVAGADVTDNFTLAVE